MSWREISLGSAIHVKHGFAFKGEFFADDGEYIVLTPGNFNEEGGFRTRPEKDRAYAGDIPEAYILGEDDLIVAMTEQGAGLLGSAALVPQTNRYLHNQRLGLVDQVDGAVLDKRFLYLLFNTRSVRAQISGSASGTKVRHTAPERIYRVSVHIPDVATQSRIAETILAYDDLIENNRRRMALVEKSARLLYHEWFVHLRYLGHERMRVIDGIPQGWEWRMLDSVCSSGDGVQTGPFGSQLHQADYSEEGIPVVMPKDIVDFRISAESIARIPESLANRLGRHRMVPGDTVYGRRGDIGRRAYIGKRQAGWFCGTGCLRIRPNSLAINPRYLFDALGSPETAGTIANRAKGSTMLNLSATALKSVSVLVASRHLQDIYAEEVEAMREMVEILEEQNAKLRAARDLLLPRLMSGEIVV